MCAYFEEADPTASIGTSEMFIVVEVYIAQEPGVGEFLTGAIKPLIASQVPSCVGQRILKSCIVSFVHLNEIMSTCNIVKNIY